MTAELLPLRTVNSRSRCYLISQVLHIVFLSFRDRLLKAEDVTQRQDAHKIISFKSQNFAVTLNIISKLKVSVYEHAQFGGKGHCFCYLCLLVSICSSFAVVLHLCRLWLHTSVCCIIAMKANINIMAFV